MMPLQESLEPQKHSSPDPTNDPTLRVLLSYYYFQDVDLDWLLAKCFTEPYPKFFADSGGFTAYKHNKPISVEEYATWVKKWGHHFECYANLDVIGSADRTEINQRQLEDMGLRPLPVFHGGESFKHLERLVEEYDYVAIGGLADVQARNEDALRFLLNVFKIAENKAKLHGFGQTYLPITKTFPWYSIDGSTWLNGFRYGKVRIWDDNRGKFFVCRTRHPEEWAKQSDLIKSYGFDWKEMAFHDGYHPDKEKIKALAHTSYKKFEMYLRRHHGLVYLNGNSDSEPGIKIWMAASKSLDETLTGADQMVRSAFNHV